MSLLFISIDFLYNFKFNNFKINKNPQSFKTIEHDFQIFNPRIQIQRHQSMGPIQLGLQKLRAYLAVYSNTKLHILNNITNIFIHIYIKNIPTILLKLAHQTSPELFQHLPSEWECDPLNLDCFFLLPPMFDSLATHLLLLREGQDVSHISTY